METIRECPFCGEKGEVVADRDHINRKCLISIRGYFVNCSNKECPIYVHTPVRRTKEEVIKIWNRRF